MYRHQGILVLLLFILYLVFFFVHDIIIIHKIIIIFRKVFSIQFIFSKLLLIRNKFNKIYFNNFFFLCEKKIDNYVTIVKVCILI